MKTLPYQQNIERVDGWEKTDSGVELRCGREICRIDVVYGDVFRVRISRCGKFDSHPSDALDSERKAAKVRFSVAEKQGELRVKTTAALLSIRLDGFEMRVVRTDGSAVLEAERGWYSEFNNFFTVTRRCPAGDAMYGLGEKTGPSNRRGREFTLWNTDVLNPNAKGEIDLTQAEKNSIDDPRGTGFDPYYVSIPFFYHSDARTGAASGFFIDNTWKAEFEFSDGGFYRYRFHGGHYDEYIFTGPAMASILERYTELTGRTALPPRWALGFHQSRWTQYTAEEFTGLGRTYSEKKIPCDALWLDIHYMQDYTIFSWNRSLFPDPEKLCREVKADGRSTVTIIDPGVAGSDGSPVYEDGMKKGMFCLTGSGSVYCGQVWPGRTVFPDFFRPEVRAWWAEWIARHAALGVRGIWNDMNEPSTGTVPADDMRFNKGKTSHRRGRNEYALQMCRATVDGLKQARPAERPFVLSRAGSAGIQRYAAVWSGDNFSRWEHLAMSIPMLCGLSASGVPFTGADVPGFAEHADPELAVRWHQCGAFYPFFRNHSACWVKERYPWSFGAAAEKLIKEAVELRYRLMPYFYSCFAEAAATGAPVMRPLWYEFQYDAAARAAEDQFLLGSRLLIAPVCAPGVTARNVYLPEGVWYDWHSGEKIKGGRWIRCETPMERIGIFVRGGSVIPLWPGAPLQADGFQPESVELRIFPPADATVQSSLYEDDGLTIGGRVLRTDFVLSADRLVGTVRGGKYPQFRRQAFVLAGPDGTVLQKLKNSGEPFDIKIRI